MASVIRGSDNFDSLLAKFDAGHNFATNGYQKLSNGLIIQWGVVSLSSSHGLSFNWNIAFPNACLMALGTCLRADGGQIIGSSNKSQDWTTTGWVNINTNATDEYSWIAIGY